MTEVDFSSCGIGPVALGHLSDWVRDATVAIVRRVVNGNPISNYGKDLSGLTAFCDARPTLKNPISLVLAQCNLKVAELNELARAMAAGAAVAQLTLDCNMITGSSQDWQRGRYHWTHDSDLSGLVSLCGALPGSQAPIALGLAHCGLSTSSLSLLAEAIAVGAIGGIDLSGCRVEPTVSAQVLSAASDASRRRLRTAQVLAFSFALHDRLGASTAVWELVDAGAVDILRMVSSIVHSRQGHEALCSGLARRHPWYEVAVRGLLSEGHTGSDTHVCIPFVTETYSCMSRLSRRAPQPYGVHARGHCPGAQ